MGRQNQRRKGALGAFAMLRAGSLLLSCKDAHFDYVSLERAISSAGENKSEGRP